MRDAGPSGAGTSGVEWRWISGFLVLGLLARTVRYFLRFPLWEDECFLAANLIDRGFRGIWQPLDYHQIAPPLFLWIELALVRTLGFTEPVLRLFAFASSVAALGLFRFFAARWLSGLSLVVAVGAFAVSYPGMRYAAEAKPYGPDALVSLTLLALFTLAVWRPERSGPLWVAAVLQPVLLGLSFPAILVAGGLVAVAAAVYARNGAPRRAWLALAAFTLSTAVSFAFWALLVAEPQRAAEASFMELAWQQSFPPIAQPWRLPWWLIATHASEFLAFPVGGPRFASSATLLLCLAGLAHLVRRRSLRILAFGLAPVCLHFAAASFHRYPYGGHSKFSLYASPLVCCLLGIGAAALVGRLRAPAGRRAGAVLLAALVVIGVVAIARDVMFPYKTMSDQRARAFAQWFWTSEATKEEVACARRDFGLDLAPGTFHELSWSAEYVCNREIYAPEESRGAPDFRRVAKGRPLLCLVYRDPRFPLDESAFEKWLSEMGKRYVLTGKESYAFPRYDKRERELLKIDILDAYRFVVRQP